MCVNWYGPDEGSWKEGARLELRVERDRRDGQKGLIKPGSESLLKLNYILASLLNVSDLLVFFFRRFNSVLPKYLII